MTVIRLHDMKPSRTPRAVTIRPTVDDYRILTALRKKLGVNASAVIRQALRALAAKESIATANSQELKANG